MSEGVKLDSLSRQVVGAAFRVGRELGPGFLEKVYENALALELDELRLVHEQQRPIPVNYKGRLVGNYLADLLVENCLVVEVKAARSIEKQHISQRAHYLKATGLRMRLLPNFGAPSVQFRRVFHAV